MKQTILNYEELVVHVNDTLSLNDRWIMSSILDDVNVNIMLGTKIITPTLGEDSSLNISERVVFDDDGYNFTLSELARTHSQLLDTLNTLDEQSFIGYDITIGDFSITADVLYELVNKIALAFDKADELEYVMQLDN